MKIQVLLALIVGFCAHSLNAQSTWTGGAGNWSSNINPGWNGTGVPDAVDAVANATGAGGTITVNGNYTVGTLTQNGSTARSLNTSTGGTLIFDVSSGNALWDMSTGLSGTGTSGGTSHSTNITLNDNLEIRGLVSSGSTQPTFSGKISGNGTLLLTNVATTPTAGGVRIDLRNGTNDFSGGINVGTGVGLRLNASGAAGTGTITLADSAGAGLNNIDFRADTSNTTQTHANNINFGNRGSGGATILNFGSSTMNVTLTGVLSGAMGTSGRINLAGGTLTLGGNSSNTWTGQLRSDSHGTLILDKTGALNNGFSMRTTSANQTTSLLVGVSETLTGQISTDGSNSGAGIAYTARLGLKDGNNGTVTFSNANKINLVNVHGIGGNATNPTTSLQLHSGNGTGTLAITTEIGTNVGNARNIEITGTGTVNLNRSAGNLYEGTTTVTGGTLLASNTTGSATSTGAVTVNSGATLGGTGIISGATTLNSGTIGTNGNTLTLGSTLTTTGTSTVATGSIVNVAGTKTVSSGTLLVNGTLGGAGSVSVASGATLGGSGTINGSLSITGVHAPGNSPGLQNVGGNLSYTGGSSVVQWELEANAIGTRGTNFDGINVGGNLDFTGATTLALDFGVGVDWNNSFWGSSYTGTGGWLIYDVAGSTTNISNLTLNAASAWTDLNGATLASIRSGSTFSLYQDGNDLYLNYSAIPEPSTSLLVLGGLAGLALLRRRKSA